MKVLFLTNIPSPYRVNFFNELGKICDLTVVFEKKFSNERDNNWKNYKFENFKSVFLKGISVATDAAICFGIRKYLKRNVFDVIVCANFSSPTGIIAVRYLKKNHIPLFLESDGGTHKNGKGFKENLKRKIITGANGYFSTGKQNDEYYSFYGADKEKIYRYPFTSLFKKDILKSVPSDKEKTELKTKLGIKEKKVVLSVGRFTYLNGYGKGYDVLINSAKNFGDDVGFYIVGGEPTAEFSEMTKNISNVHFIGFKNSTELKEYYIAADVFVLMTVGDVWGLVINEAMACGLPIITTDKCVAGLELVENGENGFILSVGDEKGLTEKLKVVLNDDEFIKTAATKSLEKIKNYTIENMAKTHIEIFNNYLNKNAKK